MFLFLVKISKAIWGGGGGGGQRTYFRWLTVVKQYTDWDIIQSSVSVQIMFK